MPRKISNVFKERKLVCSCGESGRFLLWDTDPLPTCQCGQTFDYPNDWRGLATAVIGDECDVWIRHGICNPDGSPKHYTSKAAIRQAAWEANLTQGFDTPKPNPRFLEREQTKREGYDS